MDNGGTPSGIIDTYLEESTIQVFTPVNFHVYTTLDVYDLICRDRFYKDGLYGELYKEVLEDKIHWYGQVRPDKFTSTAFTFCATDSEGNIVGEPVILTIKVTR